MSSREVRDAVHGLIELTAREWAVVDTPPFQRLRGVQQLAFTNLVYPGARHSRFEHCIGASHVAGRIARRLNQGGDGAVNEELVRLGALVHDIGHGPFSHVSEEVFEHLSRDEHVHEKVSAAITKHHPAVRKALGAAASDWIADLLTSQGHGARRSVERDIVAGPADIDKLDYLLRDSQYCGVNYGRYDLDKIVESARAVSPPGVSDTYLAFDEDAIYAIEEMLVARYHMHRQVYGHKTRLGIDRMLVRSLLLGVEEGLLDADVFSPPSTLDVDFVNAYIRWDDAEVVKRLVAAPGASCASQMMSALLERRLCKRILRYDLEALRQRFQTQLAGSVAKPHDTVLRQLLPAIEAEIAAVAGVDPHWVILHWEDRKNPVSLRFSWRILANDILLVNRDGSTALFHDRSEVFSKGEPRSQPYVSLFVRPKGDRPLNKTTVRKVEAAMLGGLERIGKATAAL